MNFGSPGAGAGDAATPATAQQTLQEQPSAHMPAAKASAAQPGGRGQLDEQQQQQQERARGEGRPRLVQPLPSGRPERSAQADQPVQAVADGDEDGFSDFAEAAALSGSAVGASQLAAPQPSAAIGVPALPHRTTQRQASASACSGESGGFSGGFPEPPPARPAPGASGRPPDASGRTAAPLPPTTGQVIGVPPPPPLPGRRLSAAESDDFGDFAGPASGDGWAGAGAGGPAPPAPVQPAALGDHDSFGDFADPEAEAGAPDAAAASEVRALPPPPALACAAGGHVGGGPGGGLMAGVPGERPWYLTDEALQPGPLPPRPAAVDAAAAAGGAEPPR